MIAYLISCDCSIKEKFVLPVGETIIGRGPFLKVTDKHVSRSHAVISNTGNKISIKSLCKNPTFHCPSGLEKFVPLKYNEETILANGEKISLLPDALVFSLVVQQEPMERKPSNQAETYSLDSEVSSKKRILPSWMVNLEETTSNKKAKKIKPMAQVADQEKSLVHNSSCLTLNKTEDLQTSEEMLVNTSQKTVNKSTVEEVPMKVAKKPSVSHSQHSALLSNNVTVDVSLNQVSKKICPHGLSCYRKNPAHFKEFDHSADQAHNEETNTKKIDKPECEYGTSCYRKNLDHLQNYTHTKNHTQKKVKVEAHTKIETRTRKLKKKSSEILEDCSENKYDLNDSFIDDEVSDEDYKPDSGSSEDSDDDEDYCHEQEDD